MFGIGFTELLLISIIAILFLGPDKLPGALVEMGKFIKSVKKTIGDAKSSLEEEMKIADLKEEALNYKKQLTEATEELRGFKNISLDDIDDSSYTETSSAEFPVEQTVKEKDPYAQAPREIKAPENSQDKVATQVEAKNDTVTLKKQPKEQKPKKQKDETDTKGDA